MTDRLASAPRTAFVVLLAREDIVAARGEQARRQPDDAGPDRAPYHCRAVPQPGVSLPPAAHLHAARTRLERTDHERLGLPECLVVAGGQPNQGLAQIHVFDAVVLRPGDAIG